MRFLRVLILLIALPESIGAYRAQKASHHSLQRIKRLITQISQRENERNAAFLVADDAVVGRKDFRRKPHHDELSINNPDEYFQGDVDLSEKQAEMLQRELEISAEDGFKGQDVMASKRRKRKIGREPLYVRWDHSRAISYDFAESIPLSTREKIRKAIELWEQHTCVRFQENGPNVDRIEFFDGGGCSSFVGRTGGTQGVSISTPGCDIVGIIAHEIGHALGIFHEQARPDQNKHIFVNYNNIPIGRWNNFHPVSLAQAETYNLPYDAGSVMHYGAYGFATDPYVATITTRDKSHQYTIGQREGPSFLDFEAINIAYRCTEHCTYMHCEHDGYTDPNNCSRCTCPDGFAGRNCEFVRYTPCGALIKASTDAVHVASPNYPGYFPFGSECIWLLKAPREGKVYLQFVGSFELQCEDTCDKSYVELKTSADFRLTGYRFCCSKAPPNIFESMSNEMVLIFRGHGEQSKGFKAKIWSNKDIEAKVSVEELTELSSTSTSSKPALNTVPPQTLPTSIPSTTPQAKLEKTLPFFKQFPAPESTLKPSSFSTVITSTPSPRFTTSAGTLTSMKNTECACSEWSEWTSWCSQQCGGCGKRSRIRECSSSDCRTEDKRACSFHACPPGTNFLINNGEFHVLWKGCCVGLFRTNSECSTLEEGQNPFLSILSSLLFAQDAKKNKTEEGPPKLV